MKSISLEDMRLFAHVVEQGNFTKAAKFCDIPKSTLSRRISELENCLGVRLLQRTTRSLTLTDLGREFYQRALKILLDVSETEHILKQQQSQTSGKIRVLSPVVFNYLFMDEITQFCHLHPDLIIEFQSLDTHPQKVKERNFDILLYPEQPGDSSLIAKQLATYRSNFYASTHYLEQHGEPDGPADLIKHDCIYLSLQEDHTPRWRFDDGNDSHWQNISPKFFIDTPELATRLCQSGLGIARLPSMLAAPFIKDGSMKAIFKGRFESKSPVYALYNDRELLPQRTRLALEYIEKTLQAKILKLEQA
jgi:DNA-binding transcriptional LysR family regulator